MIFVRRDLQPLFAREGTVDDFLAIEGRPYREAAGRKTLRFERDGRGFFIKCHWGVGWGEILKNLVSLRLPVLGASNEWRAIWALEELGVDTMRLAAYGEQGLNPASRRSFVITDELTDIESLETWAPRFLQGPQTPARIRLKHALIRKLAQISRRLHTHGINHRDYYLCHFLLDLSGGEPAPERLRLFLIDLHRVQIRRRTPRRWVVKDVAGLFFSAMDLGLSSRDLFRFMRIYGGGRLRHTLAADRVFWNRVLRRACKFYREFHGREPRLPRQIR